MNQLVKIKICGIREEEHVNLLIEEGVDAIGTVINVPKSPRNLSVKRALAIKRILPPFIDFVCVTIPNSISGIITLERILNPDVIQLHALESESFFKEIRKKTKIKLIISLPIDQDGNSKVINNDPIISSKILAKYCDALLIDTYSEITIGGSGILNNLEIAKEVKEVIEIPLILSGGLNPDNIINAIQQVRPYAVDVSSGVESSPGIKDEGLIVNFIKNAREVSYKNE
ncbi:MAG: phosphoribosylanthranilate isomerase [Candidatus Lokiarchaeota archaeon]|nr:phosphoribosylanthranilate isomerase [Candidatus Lokiarchaeota archaeon]